MQMLGGKNEGQQGGQGSTGQSEYASRNGSYQKPQPEPAMAGDFGGG